MARRCKNCSRELTASMCHASRPNICKPCYNAREQARLKQWRKQRKAERERPGGEIARLLLQWGR